jgi:hypothetical protein
LVQLEEQQVHRFVVDHGDGTVKIICTRVAWVRSHGSATLRGPTALCQQGQEGQEGQEQERHPTWEQLFEGGGHNAVALLAQQLRHVPFLDCRCGQQGTQGSMED